MLEGTTHATENGKSGIESSLIVRFLLSDLKERRRVHHNYGHILIHFGRRIFDKFWNS